MKECETCGDKTETKQAFYELDGGKLFGKYKTRVNACADCIKELKQFRQHPKVSLHKYRLIEIS